MRWLGWGLRRAVLGAGLRVAAEPEPDVFPWGVGGISYRPVPDNIGVRQPAGSPPVVR